MILRHSSDQFRQSSGILERNFSTICRLFFFYFVIVILFVITGFMMLNLRLQNSVRSVLAKTNMTYCSHGLDNIFVGFYSLLGAARLVGEARDEEIR